MTLYLDESHDLRIGSWVPSAQRADGDFPLQNLPLGVFRKNGAGDAHIGTAIGDQILDLHRAVSVGALSIPANLHPAILAPRLNDLLSRGRHVMRAVRAAVHALLRADSHLPRPPEECLVPIAGADLLLPIDVGDYTDFYSSIHHARNVGSMLRPDQPLLPNYQWVPIGYHGRASSLVVAGSPVRRPSGQSATDDASAPAFGPTRSLDYECEVGMWVGRGNPLGRPVPIAEAEEHLAGLCLVNDWSARDIQRWEYQPLGPFLSKSFATSVSPWLITLDALEPFRTAPPVRPSGDPQPLPYLDDGANRDRSAVAMVLEVWLSSRHMREQGLPPDRLSRAQFAEQYWTPAQLLTHHASNGCNLRPGDLLASGTVSGAGPESQGCLLELTRRGSLPLTLSSKETRRFLEDGDEVTLRGRCEREGFASIGFGDCKGAVLPAE